MNLPKSIRKLVESFEKLPGIGPKSAARLTFYLLHVPQEQLDEFASSLTGLKKNTVLCSTCFNVSETDPCSVCSDNSRDQSVICVVEQPLDVLAIEKTGQFKGLYHVLHGVISPLDNIGPDEIYVGQLLQRVKGRESERARGEIREIILALNPNMEGEATSMYISRKLRESENQNTSKPDNQRTRITRLGQGLPTGGDLEYADEVTLTRALEGRREY